MSAGSRDTGGAGLRPAPARAPGGRPAPRPGALSRARSRLLPLLAALSLVPAACGGGEEARGDGSIRRDSAGVEVVLLPPADPEADVRWRVGEAPEIAIGSLDGPPEQQLHQVLGAVPLPDGGVLVVNGGSEELRAYGPDGRHGAKWAEKGEGPGEFESLVWAGLLPGDSVAAWDATARALSIFAPGGTFVREVRFSLEGVFPRAVGAFGDGTIVVRKGFDVQVMMGAGTGAWRDTVAYLRVRPDGTVRDTMARLPGEETFLLSTSSGFRSQPVPFGRDAYLAVGDSLYHRAGSHAWEVRSYRPDGTLVRLIRRPAETRAVTGEMREIFRRARLESAADEEARDQLREVYAETSWGEETPVVEGLEVGSRGELWVREWRPPGAERQVWTGIGAEGEYLGRLRLPPRLRVLAFAGDRVWAVRRDELDVEYLEVRRLEPAGGAGTGEAGG